MSVVGTRDGRAAGLVVLLVFTAITLLLAIHASGWPSDNRPDVWMSRDRGDPGTDGFAILRRDFGGDVAAVVRLSGFSPEDAAGLASVEATIRDLQTLPGVLALVDPLRLPGQSGDAVARLRRAETRPLVRALALVGPSLRSVDVLLRLDPHLSQEELSALAGALDGVRTASATRGLTLIAAGHPLLAAALDAEGRRVETKFAPWLAVVAALSVLLAVRSPTLAFVAVLPAVALSVGLRSALRGLGWPSNLVLVIAGPATFVIVLAATLHVVLSFRRAVAAGADGRAAARAAISEKLVAGVVASLTTAAGFLAFVTSRVEPVRRLGVVVAVAVAASIPVVNFLVPFVLGRLRFRIPAVPVRRGLRWRASAIFALRHRRAVILTSVALMVLGGIAPFHLEWGTNAVDYFPDGHPVREQFLELTRTGASLTTFDVLASRADGEEFRPADLGSGHVSEVIAGVPGVMSVIGPELVLQELKAAAGAAGPLLFPAALRETSRISADRRRARYTVRLQSRGAGETLLLADHVLSEVRRAGPAGVSFMVAGTVLEMFAMQTELLSTLGSSLGLTLLVTAVLFFLVARTGREYVAGLASNLTPAGAVLLCAFVCGFRLDGATVMVASVVLGLVGNTFHLLAGAGPKPGRFRLRTVLRGFDRVGEAATVSYVALASGFFTLMLSGFLPTSRFGLLAAIGVVLALAGDMLVLPAIWLSGLRRAQP